ncbi:MAG: site-specific integrase [Spirochaetota bacterium]|nr:site-specific integrase [Spirochaetota bacterium]
MSNSDEYWKKLFETGKQYLIKKGFKSYAVNTKTQIWKQLKDFTETHSDLDLNADIVRDFLVQKFQTTQFHTINNKQRRMLSVANLLLFIASGISSTVDPSGLRMVFSHRGATILMREYLLYLTSEGRSLGTIRQEQNFLNFFSDYLVEEGIVDLSSFSKNNIPSFLFKLENCSLSIRARHISCFRSFLKYLHEKNIIPENISFFVPSLSYNKFLKIPSVYTQEEVNKMLAAIDLGNPCGKRDNAMVRLAVHLGLRSGDIRNLKCKDITWMRNHKDRIRFVQQKTGTEIMLPIPEDVSEAIIDYLTHGRPSCESKFLFVQHHSPFKPMLSDGFYKKVSDYFRHAGIDTEGRKHGPHACRHSFGTNLLEKNIGLPVISDILGHKSTTSTLDYLRVAENQLRTCALEFLYEPKGGRK